MDYTQRLILEYN